MLKNIATNYKNMFSSTGKIILLFLICVGLGAIIVFPLWKFATVTPNVYSTVVMIIMAITAIFLCFKRIKQVGIKKFLKTIAKIFIIALGLYLCFAFVLNGQRLFAIPTLIVMIILYGICSINSEKTK